MSFQAGLFSVSGRPPLPTDIAWACKAVTCSDYGDPKIFTDGSVLLAVAGSPRDGRVDNEQLFSYDDVAITFDGRLDNLEDLLSCLRPLPGGCTTDAALAMAAYRNWGADGLARLIGDWSLTVWDKAARSILIASDFAGVRPLYYCVLNDVLLWSTRLGALVERLGPGDFDDDYIAGFLTFGGCPNRTPYRGIHSVPPAHHIRVDSGGVTAGRFWQLPVERSIRFERDSEYEECLRSLFREAVRSRVRTDTGVIADLSGGLDSSSIVCMIKELGEAGGAAGAVPVTTITYEHPGSRDKPFYTAVENFCGFENIHVPVTEHPLLSPVHAGGAMPAFWQPLHMHLASTARHLSAQTYLTGLLGDSVMGNWWDDTPQISELLRTGRLMTALRESILWSRVLRVPAALVLWEACRATLSGSPNERQLTMLSTPDFGTEDSISSEYRRRTRLSDPGTYFSDVWKHSRPDRKRHFRVINQNLELRRLQAPEPLEHLNYTHPFAHRPLVEFMLWIPARIVCRPGEPRRLMRRAFDALLPPEVRDRRSKDSFAAVYLQSLKPIATTLLSDLKKLEVVQRGYIDPTSLSVRLRRLMYSLDCNEPQLRHVLLLEMWLRSRRTHDGQAIEPHMHDETRMREAHFAPAPA